MRRFLGWRRAVRAVEPVQVLVHAVSEQVLGAELARLRDLDGDSMLWRAIVAVLGARQFALMRKAMMRDVEMKVRVEALARAAGVGEAIAVLEAERTGRAGGGGLNATGRRCEGGGLNATGQRCEYGGLNATGQRCEGG